MKLCRADVGQEHGFWEPSAPRSPLRPSPWEFTPALGADSLALWEVVACLGVPGNELGQEESPGHFVARLLCVRNQNGGNVAWEPCLFPPSLSFLSLLVLVAH